MMTGYLPRLVWLGFQLWGIWNCTYICPIMIDALFPAVELVAYIVVLGTPPTKRLPWSLRLSGPLVKAPSLPFPSACADAPVATMASSSMAKSRRPHKESIAGVPVKKRSFGMLTHRQIVSLQESPSSSPVAEPQKLENFREKKVTPGGASRQDFG